MPDAAAYIRSFREVKRESDLGFIAYDCPLCGDSRGRGWVHVDSLAAGCFNGGCDANPRLSGGIAELARRVEGLPSVSAAWAQLNAAFPGGPTRRPKKDKQDWCTLPPSFDNWSARIAKPFADFARLQWGIDESVLRAFDVRYCTEGRYRERLIVPVRTPMGVVSGFVARTIAPEASKRYLASKEGVDCGTSVGDLFFNLDRVVVGEKVVIVEGCGDVFNLHARGMRAVGALGSSISSRATASLVARSPAEVCVAFDADQPALTARFASGLKAWGIRVTLGSWKGAKDAGAGAKLEVAPATLQGVLAMRLGR